MPAFVLPPQFHKILVVGPLYNNINKLARLEKNASQYDWIIFNGGLCYPPYDIEEIKLRITKMKEFITKYRSLYLVGRFDYLLLTQTQDHELEHWITNSFNVALIDFPNRNIVVVDGGIPNSITKRIELFNNLEVSFTCHINNQPWHQDYNNRVGYVISNNPLTHKPPQYYLHSMQLGNRYNTEANTYAVEVDEIGLKKTITL
jgi:hypothetical protein